MADKPNTTSPMYPGIEYVRVQQDGVEFTTAKTSVTKDMKVLKDADAVNPFTGVPLEPAAVKSTTSSNKSS